MPVVRLWYMISRINWYRNSIHFYHIHFLSNILKQGSHTCLHHFGDVWQCLAGSILHGMGWRGTVTPFTLFSPSRNGASAIDYPPFLRQPRSVNVKFYRVSWIWILEYESLMTRVQRLLPVIRFMERYNFASIIIRLWSCMNAIKSRVNN